MLYVNLCCRLCALYLLGHCVGIYARGPWAHMVGGTMEQNAIYHVMAHAVALGHCLPYTVVNADGSTPSSEQECTAGGGAWTPNPESGWRNGFGNQPGEPGDQCAPGKRYDPCSVCGGTAVPSGTAGKPALNEQTCDCAGHVLDDQNICGGFGLDVCGVPGGPGIAPGKCDCAGNVQDCTGTVTSHP